MHRSLAPVCFFLALCALARSATPAPPHIILVMADDMGWGQTGYNGHPRLKTPHLDAMAAAGLRFDRFYAGAPNCSPTRATVLTGRTNDRTGTRNHGYALRRQEKTLAQALKAAGYVTAHFGKWHLNGYSGPGAPLLPDDPYSPSAFGFDEWLSTTNFFDLNPLLGRKGVIEEFAGDSSEIIVAEALRFLEKAVAGGKPTLTLIWFGTPHSPFRASEADQAAFADLNEASRQHYGELVAMDRSVGALRSGLRRLGLHENTLVWFCSDNGGLPGVSPGSVGGLRGFKNTMYEGGLRVPALIEWPAGISQPRTTTYPAGTVDIFPTLAEIAGLPADSLLTPADGKSLVHLFTEDSTQRDTPLGFRHTDRAAWIDNSLKLVFPDLKKEVFELYDLASDPGERNDLAQDRPDLAARLLGDFRRWNASVEASMAGRDYSEGRVTTPAPGQRDWRRSAEYAPYLDEWKTRPEYQSLNAPPAKAARE
jgi:arylsulfatase A-like enzyme